MKLGSVLKEDVVATALKKNGGYKVVGFTEKRPPPEKPKTNVVIVGISGMT